MKIRDFILLLTLFIFSLSVTGCQDKVESVAIPSSVYILSVNDVENEVVRSKEPIVITSYGTDNKISYKRTYITDDNGKLKLSLNQGKYQAAFAFAKGKEIDNFYEFEILPNASGEITMNVEDQREHFQFSIAVIDDLTLTPRKNEPLSVVSLDDNGDVIAEKKLTTDNEGKVSLRVVAGKYRALFAYVAGEISDNTFEFNVDDQIADELTMNVKVNNYGDRKPLDYVYYSENFDWLAVDPFQLTDYMDGSYNTTEQLFSALDDDPVLKAVIDNSGWSFQDRVYLRKGYIKYGIAGSSRGMSSRYLSEIEAGKHTNINLTFKTAKYITKSGTADDVNIVDIIITGDGSFSQTESVKKATYNITNILYNEWCDIKTVIYNVNSGTKLSIGKETAVAKCRFFLDNISVSKHSTPQN